MTHPAPDFLDLQSALAGEYSLQRELGRGGMGIVYLARDVQLDRDVAIKVLPAERAADPAARERFLREARLAAGLSHPHIVPIHRVREADGFVFFVMGYVEGETLGERLRRTGPLLPAEAMRILREVAWALAYAHGRGIVHRDVKPDNILLEAATGRALVTDFGIATASVDEEREAGGVLGTQHFMSPEQAVGEAVDGRSDLYALGVVGYLAVSGRLPFEGGDLSALVLAQATQRAPSVLTRAPGLPPALGATIDRCLARDPAERFDDGEALAAALAPLPDTRPALSPALRAWLAARNPLAAPYLAWSGVFGTLAGINTLVWLTRPYPMGMKSIAVLSGLAAAPLLPVLGFHLNQAYRQFKAGYSLADLREALAVGQRERAESDALEAQEREPAAHRVLRLATVAAGTWFGTLAILMVSGVVHESELTAPALFVPLGTTLALGALSNALGVRFIPEWLRSTWRTQLRDRLWASPLGAWLAKRLGAPERSRALDANAFRATEAALGAALGDLFAALPLAYREQLAELPALVESLEARAAEARAELDALGAMAPAAAGHDPLAARRDAARRQLTESVAALEGVRLDLLRLHAGAGDLAPLTTLVESARRIGEDAARLAAAQQEVEDAMARRDR